jgi:hypothetical protein
MKPFEVALFKHFIDGKGMATVYINLYRKHHLKKNPTSIEEFLLKADVNDVCTQAFYFVINERWGFDYWREMQKEWLEFLSLNENNYAANEWWKMEGMAKILRYNWDAARHWRKESRYTAALRLGVDLSLLGLQNKEHTAPPTKMSEEYLREKGLEAFKNSQETTQVKEPECPTHELIEVVDDDDANDLLGDFIDVDLKPKASERRRLKDNEISVNMRKNTGRITFNQTLSRVIKERGGYEYAALLHNSKGDVIIKLNDESGVPVQDGTRSRENSNVCIHSITFTEKLVEFLGIERDYVIINVSEVAKTDDYVAYLVTK